MSRIKDEKYTTRTPGQPTSNKHKAHRAQISSKKCAAYLSRGQRVKNRDRRLARIAKGFAHPTSHSHLDAEGMSTRQPHDHIVTVRNGEVIKTCTIERTYKDKHGKTVTERASIHHGFGKGPTAIPRKMSKRNPKFCFNHHRWEATA